METQQNNKCWLWVDRNETIDHLKSEYSKLAQKTYKTRYEWMGKVIYWESCKKSKFDNTNKWSMHGIRPREWNEQTPQRFWDTNGSANLSQTTRPSDNQQKREPVE